MLSPSLGREEDHIDDYSKSNICRRSELPLLLYSLPSPWLEVRVHDDVYGKRSDSRRLCSSGFGDSKWAGILRSCASTCQSTFHHTASSCRLL